jgi:hypothetical protein
MRGEGGIMGSQPMRTAVHLTCHCAQINFGDVPLYLIYDPILKNAGIEIFWSYCKDETSASSVGIFDIFFIILNSQEFHQTEFLKFTMALAYG